MKRRKPKEISLAPPTLGESEATALRQVIDSGWITMGETVKQFETAFAQAHGADDAVAVSSGTAGLHLSLASLGIGPGDEVLVPSLTFVATANAAWYTGATPVLVDIEDVIRPCISLEDARARLTPRTKAVIVVHYGGWLCPMAQWREFADEHGLVLVEDASHAAGMKSVGEHSDAAVFSFYGNKNMTTAEGGMVLTSNPDTAARLRRLRSHSMTSLTRERYEGGPLSYDVTDLGFNYRMDELRAALGLIQLERLPEWNQIRAEILQRYRTTLESGGAVVLPFDAREPTAAHLCPALLPEGADREVVMLALREAGIHSSFHYPPIHTFSYHATRLNREGLRNTDDFAAREITLPLHPGLDVEDVDRVTEKVSTSLTQRRVGAK